MATSSQHSGTATTTSAATDGSTDPSGEVSTTAAESTTTVPLDSLPACDTAALATASTADEAVVGMAFGYNATAISLSGTTSTFDGTQSVDGRSGSWHVNGTAGTVSETVTLTGATLGFAEQLTLVAA